MNRKILKEIGVYSLSTILFQGSRFLCFFLSAKLLGPEEFGLWNLLSLLLLYRGITHLGVIPAMNREVPFLIGENKLLKVRKIRNVTFSYSVLLTLISSLLLLAITVFILNVNIKTSILAMISLFFFTQIYHYLQVYLKSSIQFNVMAWQQILLSIFFPLTVIPLTLIYKLPGFIFGQTIAIFLICLFISKKIEWKPSIDLDVKEFLHLLKVGFPIMLVSLLYSLFTTSDRWIISAYLSHKALGFYSLAILFGNALFLLPRTLAEQAYPRMVKLFGESHNFRKVFKLKLKYLLLCLAITIPEATLMYVSSPIIIKTFLPHYTPSIEVIGLTIIGFLFLAIANFSGIFLLSIGKQVIYLFITLFSIGINVVLSITLVKAGYGIKGVAIGSAISYFSFSVCSFLITAFILKRYGGKYATQLHHCRGS